MSRFLIFYIYVFIAIQATAGQTSSFRDTIPYGNILDENLLISVYNQDYTKALQYIKKGAKVNTTDNSGYTPLIYAIGNKDLQIINLLLSNGADVNLIPLNDRDPSPLIMTAKLGYTDIASLLLKNKANVSAGDYLGAKALHYAALYNDTVLTQLLLEYHANVNDTTNEGETPLFIAAYNGSNQVFEMLMQQNSDLEFSDNKGFTPLMVASQNGHYNIVLRLLQNWADVNRQNHKGFSALSMAIANGYGDIVDLLRLNGANVNEQNTLSLNPRGLARAFHQTAIADSLKSSGAKLNYLPYFIGFCPEIEVLFNNKDLITGVSFAKIDLKYQLELAMHYYFRTSAVTVLQKSNDNSFTQYWERRHRIGLSLSKSLTIYTDNNKSAGFYLGSSYDLHFGFYRGTTIPIQQGFYLSPFIGVFYKNNSILTKLSCNYTNYQIKGLTNWYAGFSMMYRLWTKPQKFNKDLKLIE